MAAIEFRRDAILNVVEDDAELIKQELEEIELVEPGFDPSSSFRVATPEEIEALHRSIADEKAFDGAFGRMIRNFALLEEQLDGMLMDLIAAPDAKEAFWRQYLHRRAIGRRAADLKAIVSSSYPSMADRAGRLVAKMNSLATRRNTLVHQVVVVSLPLNEADTKFSPSRRFRNSQADESLTSGELDQLAADVETTFLRLVSLEQALTRADRS